MVAILYLKLKIMFSNYQYWQEEVYGNILNEPIIMPNGEIYESNIDEIERQAEWVNIQYELQLINYE